MKNKEPRAKSQELRREDQRQRIEGRIIKRVPFAIHLLLLALSFLLLAICGCSGLKEARDIKTAPMPPKYVEAKQKESYAGEGSLWIDKASLYEDLRARRLNDIVTILITETTNASKKATTNDTSTSSLNNAIPNVLGISQLTKRLGNFQQGIQG